MGRIMLALCIICCCHSLIAQENTPEIRKNRVAIATGFHTALLKDINFSPLIYREQGVTYRLTYRRELTKNTWNFRAAYGSGNIRTRVLKELSSDYILGELALKYLRETQLFKAERHQLFLGAQYHFYVHYLDWNKQTAFSFYGNHSLGISAGFDQILNSKNKVCVFLDIPLLNVVVRPPYNGIDEELSRNNDEGEVFQLITDGYWGSFNSVLAYQFQAQYYHLVSKRFALTLNYSNSYQRTYEQHPYAHMMNQFFAGLEFNF